MGSRGLSRELVVAAGLSDLGHKGMSLAAVSLAPTVYLVLPAVSSGVGRHRWVRVEVRTGVLGGCVSATGLVLLPGPTLGFGGQDS